MSNVLISTRAELRAVKSGGIITQISNGMSSMSCKILRLPHNFYKLYDNNRFNTELLVIIDLTVFLTNYISSSLNV